MDTQTAILILNYNDYNETIKCVDNLIKLKIKELIVIIDNDSNNNSYSILKEKYENQNKIEVIKTEKNGGYSYGNNFGIKYVLAAYPNIKYFCIMNPDVRIMYKEIFSNLINKLEFNEKIAAISPIMLQKNKLNFDGVCWEIPNKKTIYYNHIIFLKNKKRRKEMEVNENFTAIVDVIPGSFFIIKKDEIVDIGFLDENVFLYNEENILAIKLLQKNKHVALSINDFYQHNHKEDTELLTLNKRLKKNKIGYDSRKYLCKCFYDRSSLLKLYIVNFFNIIYIILISAYKKIERRIKKNEK